MTHRVRFRPDLHSSVSLWCMDCDFRAHAGHDDRKAERWKSEHERESEAF